MTEYVAQPASAFHSYIETSLYLNSQISQYRVNKHVPPSIRCLYTYMAINEDMTMNVNMLAYTASCISLTQ